jgi:uncharacterized membrane protein
MDDAGWQPVVRLGFAMVIVGLLIFAFSGANFQWLIDHGYIYNAPTVTLIIFLLIGALLVAGGSRWKKRLESVSTNTTLNQ